MNNDLSYLELIGDHSPGGRRADGVLIMLHGLGASGHDFSDLPRELNLRPELKLAFILPHAPEIPVTINRGMVMPAWYDIKSIDFEREVDHQGVRNSCDRLMDLIDQQVAKGYKAQQIFIGGFSQGGAMAVEVTAEWIQKTGHQLGGLVVLSSYLIDPKKIAEKKIDQIPIFMAHGTRDLVVPFQLGKSHALMIEKQKFHLTWREYPMDHSVSKEELIDLSAWLDDQMSSYDR